jgi:adenylate cyclase
MKPLAFLVFLFFGLSSVVTGQTRQIDSMKALLKTQPKDTTYVNTLLALSKSHFNIDPVESIRYGYDAKHYAEELKFKPGIALAYKNIGIAYFNQGKYIEALQQYELSLSAYEAIGDKRGMATLLKNTGNVYINKGDDDKALEYYLKSLKLTEEINDTLKMLEALGNIGFVYMNKPATHDKAFQYLRQAYALNKRFNDANSQGAITVNLGELHMTYDRYDSAMLYFNESLKAYEGTVDMAYTLNDIGKLYRKQKKFGEAIAIQRKALDIAQKLDSQNDVAIALLGIAESFEQRGDAKLALDYYHQADSIATATGAKYELVNIYAGLARVYAIESDYTNAFTYQNKLAEVKDAIYNLEIDKKLGTLQFTYDLEKKGAEITLLNKDREMRTKELETQKAVRNGFIFGFAALLAVAVVILLQRNRISKEKKRSEALLLNILPEETAHELKQFGKAKAHRYESVTVLFTDFKGFSTKAEDMAPEVLVEVLDFYFAAFDYIIVEHGLEKIKTIGDAYMCACGLPTPDPEHAVKVIRAAISIREFCAREAIHRFNQGLPFFEVRIGVNTGPVVAGIVGVKKFAYDIWGDTVNMASRMESSGVPGKVNISGTTYEAVKDTVKCTYRGKVSVKHKDDVEMYFADELIKSGTPAPIHQQAFEVDAHHPLLKNAIQTTHKSKEQTSSTSHTKS